MPHPDARLPASPKNLRVFVFLNIPRPYAMLYPSESPKMSAAKSITTGGGDKGMTRLFSGEQVPKSSARTEACGDLDELVGVLGVARAMSRRKKVREAILEVQRDLFVIGSELATTAEKVNLLPRRVDAKMVRQIDRQRKDLEARIQRSSGFIIPGENPAAAYIDLARAVARRGERKVAGLVLARVVRNQLVLVWMNRLSDCLWLLARLEEGKST
jgi:cob(I)alamin adenosyltransferase